MAARARVKPDARYGRDPAAPLPARPCPTAVKGLRQVPCYYDPLVAEARRNVVGMY